VTAHLGYEKAREVVEAVAVVLGKDWKDRLLYNKLAGLYQITNTVMIELVDPSKYVNTNTQFGKKILSIKALRALTGEGLTRSKNIIENAGAGPQTCHIDNHYRETRADWLKEVDNWLNDLKDCGFKVTFI
jgi:hypothetical protein